MIPKIGDLNDTMLCYVCLKQRKLCIAVQIYEDQNICLKYIRRNRKLLLSILQALANDAAALYLTTNFNNMQNVMVPFNWYVISVLPQLNKYEQVH